MHIWNKLNKEQGFTLIEILAAITLLTIVLVAFVPFFSNYAIFTRVSENTLTAVNIADEAGHQLKENQSSISIPDISDCNNTRKPIDDLLTVEAYPYERNNKNYYAYICQSDNAQEHDLGLYRVRIDIELEPEPNDRAPITHIYTYLDQESSESE